MVHCQGLLVASVAFNMVKLCVNCGARWQQSKLGLCRRCERKLGADLRNTQERERDAIERRRAEALNLERATYTPAAKREIRVGGQTFIVQWDGSR